MGALRSSPVAATTAASAAIRSSTSWPKWWRSRHTNSASASTVLASPGHSKGRGYDLLRAAQDAVTPEAMGAMMRRALRMALEGNLPAMRFVAECTLGRTQEALPGGTPIDIALPKLVSTDACLAAIDRVNDVMVRGAITVDVAKTFLDMITVRVKAIEVKDLAQRLAALEASAGSVEHSANHRGSDAHRGRAFALGPVKWTYVYLYVLMDIFSRYVDRRSLASARASRKVSPYGQVESEQVAIRHSKCAEYIKKGPVQ